MSNLVLMTKAAIAAARQAASPFASSPDVPQTPYLGLNLPPTGFPSWGGDLNSNFVTLDSAVGSLQNSYQGTWQASIVYAHGQIVIHNGLVFISLTNGNVNRQPDLSPDVWGPMGAATSIGYPAAGVAVSTGSAWDVSIDPNALARMDFVNPGNFSAQKSVRAYGTQGPLDISQTVAFLGTGQGNNPNLTFVNATGAVNEKGWTILLGGGPEHRRSRGQPRHALERWRSRDTVDDMLAYRGDSFEGRDKAAADPRRRSDRAGRDIQHSGRGGGQQRAYFAAIRVW